MDQETLRLASLSIDQDERATVIVGKDQERFVVRQDLLIRKSNFFRAALTGPFKEAHEKVVRLPDEKPPVLEIFAHWLTHNEFPVLQIIDGELVVVTTEDVALHPRPHPDCYIDLYIFADKYDCKELRNFCIQSIYDGVEGWTEKQLPRLEKVKAVFNILLPHHILCRFLVDLYCNHGERGLGLNRQAFGTFGRSGKIWNDFLMTRGSRWTLIIEDYLEK